MTKIKIAFAVVLTVLSLFGCFYIASAFTSSGGSVAPPPDRVLTILKSENLDFLVRRRQVTQVVLIRTADSSWLDWVPYVGTYREALKEDGVLTANVRVYYGFDMINLPKPQTRTARKELRSHYPNQKSWISPSISTLSNFAR